MSSVNSAGQQPRLCIDLNVEYRAEDDDAMNDDRVRESGTPPAETHEVGRSISQIHIISDSAQTSFSMRHGVPQAQTSLRAPRDQAIDAGKMVVSIENANQRISMTSSLPSTFILPRDTGSSSSFLATEQTARIHPSCTSLRPEASASSSEARFARPGSQSSGLPFASSSNAGQSGETSEGRIPNNAPPLNKKRYPVPKHLRKPDETDETRITRSALIRRQLVPVPAALRLAGETDQTRISKNTLTKRQLVFVPEGLRLEGEADQTRIPKSALSMRILKKRGIDEKRYPVPEELRKSGETDETRVLAATLSMRRLVPVPEALRLEGETDQTRLSRNALLKRKRQWIPVPPEFRFKGETDDTRIRFTTLTSRKKLVLLPEALREPGETENTKVTNYILQSRKREREAEQNSAGKEKSIQTE
ncbi:MAG: hypothetical protein P8176_11360 [Gammaproteobacteria bacterium]